MQFSFLMIVLQFDLPQLFLELGLPNFELFPERDNTFMQLADLFVLPGHRALDVFPLFEARSFQFLAESHDRLVEMPQFEVVFHARISYKGTKN